MFLDRGHYSSNRFGMLPSGDVIFAALSMTPGRTSKRRHQVIGAIMEVECHLKGKHPGPTPNATFLRSEKYVLNRLGRGNFEIERADFSSLENAYENR